MTNFEKLTATKPELARFLRSLPILEAPWDTEFQKKVLQQMSFAGLRLLPARREAERSGLVAWLES